MSLILGLETSTKICSVAISNGNKLLAIKEEGGAYSHSEKLTLFIQDVLSQAGLKLEDVDAIAVSKGPGSYTGLRIGVSVAKGLCYALSKPLIAIDTLQAMALNMSKQKSGKIYCPMIDARRMEVYTALYDEDNNSIEPVNAKIIKESSFADYLKDKPIVFFGDGSEKCKETFLNTENAIFSEEGLPSAEFINELAQQKLLKNEVEDVAYFEPYYLKDFIATTPKKLL